MQLAHKAVKENELRLSAVIPTVVFLVHASLETLVELALVVLLCLFAPTH